MHGVRLSSGDCGRVCFACRNRRRNENAALIPRGSDMMSWALQGFVNQSAAERAAKQRALPFTCAEAPLLELYLSATPTRRFEL